jgi:hypothetical protein
MPHRLESQVGREVQERSHIRAKDDECFGNGLTDIQHYALRIGREDGDAAKGAGELMTTEDRVKYKVARRSHINGVKAVRFAATQALDKLERLDRNVRPRTPDVANQIEDDIEDIAAILHALIGADERENVPDARPEGYVDTKRPRKPYTHKARVPARVVVVSTGSIKVEEVKHGLGRTEVMLNLVGDVRDQSGPPVSEGSEHPVIPLVHGLAYTQGPQITGVKVTDVVGRGVAFVSALEHKDG